MFSQSLRRGGASKLAAFCAAAMLSGLAGTPVAQAQPAAEAPQGASDWVPGRLIVVSRAGLSDSAMAKVAKKHGGKAHRVGKSNLHVIELPKAAPETALRHVLARDANLKVVELDRRVPHDAMVNDPYTGSQWHLPKIGAPAAWDITQGNGIVIAILDSGVQPNHPDLASKLVPGWNFYDNNANTTDVTGHGTSVAGAAAAISNNGAGVAGIAGSARIMPLRVADTSGYAYYSTIAQALVHAADNGARVANASYAGAYGSAAVQSAAQYFRSKGGLLTVSAGNTGANANSSRVTSLIPVASTGSNDVRASTSTYGEHVALSAPGVGIWTTANNGGYRSASGTSYSAPIAAGVIALMMAANPALSPEDVQNLLFSTATDLGAAGRDIYYGHGRVDAASAVAAAAAAVGSGPVDSQPPVVSITSPVANASVSGQVAVDVSASDNVGVARVDLSVNGNTIGSDTAAPFQFSGDTKALPNGPHVLVATAYDSAGNVTASAPVTVNVANADKTPPHVEIRNPVNGSTMSGVIQIRVRASDDSGAAGIKLSLYIIGNRVAVANGPMLTYDWNTAGLAKGKWTLLAVATDAAGNLSSSKVQVTNY